jgi:ABC-2 type transport system permease protein
MSTLTYAAADSATMLRRQLRHILRYPSMTVMLIGMPVIFLLLFVYVFGGTLGAGLPSAAGLPAGVTGRTAYLDYVTPGIVLATAGTAATGTSVSIAMDMAEGIVARFRTMAIFRPAILIGHVVGSVTNTLLGVVVVFGVALAIGFRSPTGPLRWLAAAGLIVLFVLALTWLSIGLGLAAKSVESASNTPMPLMLLPFLSSGFVPTASMPAGLRWFAEYQPFTPVIQTLRGLLFDAPIGRNGVLAAAWCVVITVAGFLWARNRFDRSPAATP